MKKLIHNPHDKYFRASFSDPRVAKAFFQHYLPATILNVGDLESLRLEKDTFIDEPILKISATDLLFSATLAGHPGYLYLLTEHQSTPSKLMPFRILKYMINIMELHLKNTQSDKLPVIFPIVLYTGTAPYNYSTDILDLFDDPCHLAKDIFAKPFKLITLQQIPDATLRQQLWLGIFALCMKHVFARDVLPHLQGMLQLLQQAEQEGGSHFIQTALTYLLKTGEVSDSRLFLETVQTNLSEETGAAIMTIAQQIEAKGIEKGLQQGMQQGRLELAKELWQQGMPLENISKAMKVSVIELQSLLSEKDINH